MSHSHWSGPTFASHSRTAAILAGNLIPQVIASAFVIARIISKGWIRRAWGADDTMLCVAWVTSLILTVLSCLQTEYGAGIHINELPVSALEANLKLDYASRIFYNLALSLTKITICLFYFNIFADPLNRLLTKIALVFIILYTIPLELVSLFQCTPVAAIWDREIKNARCVDMFPHFIVSAACNMLADAWLVVQVVPNILPLQIPKRQKVILLFVVSLGWLVIVASIFRICRLNAVTDKDDFTWADYDLTVWSAVEVDVGLICVAAPATKPLFKKIAPEFLRSLTDKASNPSGGHALGTMARRPTATLPLHSRDGVAETKTAGSLSRNWDIGGLLTTFRGDGESVRRTSVGSLGNIVKSVDVTVETHDLERASESVHEVGSYRSSWGSNLKIQA